MTTFQKVIVFYRGGATPLQNMRLHGMLAKIRLSQKCDWAGRDVWCLKIS